MNVYWNHSKEQSLRNWAITIACILVSISGVVLSLICIYAGGPGNMSLLPGSKGQEGPA